MASTPPPSTQATPFIRASQAFQSELSSEDRDDFAYTKLEDLQQAIQEIQSKQGRKSQNLARMKPFLEGIQQYGQIVEVFLNVSNLIAFVWGPTKFVLQIASNYAEAFDELLDVYCDIGESIPLLAQYGAFLKENPYMNRVLELIYEDILEFHRRAYHYFKKRVWRQLFQTTWKTFRSRFNPVIAKLRRHKHLVESQASLAQFEEIQKLHLQAENEFRILRDAEDLRRRSEVREWLSPANTEEDHENVSFARSKYPGVCRWTLQNKSIQSWLKPSSNSNKPLLWINGIPGAGKSTVASFLVDELRKDPSKHTLFFYCKHGDKERNSFAALARALIHQAVHQDDDLLPFVYEESATCGEKPLQTQSRAEKMLELVLQSFVPAYIIIDGLDECDPSQTAKIISWFKKFVQNESQHGNSHTRCLLLSQDNKETHQILKLTPQISILENDITGDIKVFCNVEGLELQRKFALTESERDKIIGMVVDEAHGMFLYAKLVMKNLMSHNRLAKMREELKPGTFPKGLDQAYGRIVDRILIDPGLQESERLDSKQLLGLLAFAKRPLKWTEIQGVASIDLENRNVDFEGRCFRVHSKSICGSLVEIRPGGTVELVHSTAKQYLIHKTHLIPAEEETALSSLCLGYLTFPCFDYGIPEETIERFVFTGHYIFMEYALVHWADHLLDAAKTNSLTSFIDMQATVESFLRSHCTTSLHERIVTFQKVAQTWPSGPFEENLRKFVAEASEDLDISAVFLQIRSHMEGMTSTQSNKMDLEKLYGPDLFRCSRINCGRFFEGYTKLDERERHHKYHERKFFCTYEGCIGTRTGLGFVSADQLNQHIKRFHDPFIVGVSQAPENFNDTVIAAIENEDVERLRLCFAKRSSKDESLEVIVVGDSMRNREHRLWWSTAMRLGNEEIIAILIDHTDSRKDSWNCIINLAIRNRRLDLFRRFRHQAHIGRRLQTNGPAFVAVNMDDADALRVVINSDDTSKFRRKLNSLWPVAMEAVRSGKVACVRYLISECGLNPFEDDSSNTPVRAAHRSVSTQDVQRHHSMIYNAIAAGQMAVCRCIFGYVTTFRLSDSEGLQTLARAASSNGHQEILRLLMELDDQMNPAINDGYMMRATLYNDIRYRQGGIEVSLDSPDLDEPDDRGCSLLLYAALNGHFKVVDQLLTLGADVNRKGNCTEITSNNYRDQNALTAAVYNGHVGIVQRLLQIPNIGIDGSIVFKQGTSRTIKKSSTGSLQELAELRGFSAIAMMIDERKYRCSKVQV